MHEIGRGSNWDMVKSRKMEALENIWIRGQDRERERGEILLCYLIRFSFPSNHGSRR